MDKKSVNEQPFITREDTLLVIIDVQERLLPAISGSGKIIENTNRLLALSRVLGLPVIFSEQEKLGATIPQIKEQAPHFDAVSKVTFNCFLNDDFADKVRETERRTLVMSGVEAHICVAQTALWAHPHFRVQVVGDAIGSRSPDNHHIAIERMRMSGVTITSTEMVIYELLRKAGTEEFKAILPYIK
ncbi:MAG: Isochorismatase family protein [Syntrophorhabdaceae bacterium PtaU1.Bin034]|nr:MAG: Isochorismatase family protein [Syntrophorhabdaceae bacterium PtaU1.Bin034]